MPLKRSYEQALDLMEQRIASTISQVDDQFPHYADPETGQWVTTQNGDWTGCYWSGMLWLALASERELSFQSLLKKHICTFAKRSSDDTVSRGFLYYFGVALGAILCDDDEARKIATMGARALAATYNPHARIIPVGANSEETHSMGSDQVTIDGMVGAMPLLAWAAWQLDEPQLREIARQDALRHREFCIRPDGSVCQSASFDPLTGKLLRRYSHKGLSDSSTWSRAQAWAIVAFSHAAQWIPEQSEFIETAHATADWWIANAPSDDIVFWDFSAASLPGANRDSSASAIAAAGLLHLSTLVPDRSQAHYYRENAERIVTVLIQSYLTPTTTQDTRMPGILTSGSYNEKIELAAHHELIWGSYYLYQSLNILAGRIRPGLI